MLRQNKILVGLLFVLLCNNSALCVKKQKKDPHQTVIDKYKDIKVKDINLNNRHIKKDSFLFGVGTSSYQVEGPAGSQEKTYTQWLDIAGKKVEIEVDNKKEIKTIPTPQQACQHWQKYKEDIQLIKKLGCNTYRFSISWGKVEPKKGTFNNKALKHYENVCKELQKNKIRPVITLYHYAHPQWFEKKGAFEKKENITDFVNYGIKVFERLHKYNPIWFTINTFSGTSFHSYYMATKPPFKKDMGLALQVLKHALEAHVSFYRKAKAIKDPITKKVLDSTIGIYKTVFPVEKYRSWQFWDNIGISFVHKLNNESIYEFFTTGKLNITLGIPALFIKNSISHENKKAIGALDCIGLNYYSGASMSNFKLLPLKKNIPTQNSLLTIHPDGFYTALHQVNNCLAKPLAVPIYVTENGIATTNSIHRDVFYKSHLQMLSRAMQEDIDVRGYMVWSLMDNFDWLEGYDLNFGLYAVDRKTQKRTLKPGTEFFIDVIKTHNAKTIKEIEKKH